MMVSRWFMWNTVDDLSFEATVGNCSNDSMIGTQWYEKVDFTLGRVFASL
jgi:hypothetical protein